MTRQRDGRLATEISAAVWSLSTTQLNGQRRGAGHVVETSVACLAWMSYRMISLRYVRHLCSPVLHTDTSPCSACRRILVVVSGVDMFRLKCRGSASSFRRVTIRILAVTVGSPSPDTMVGHPTDPTNHGCQPSTPSAHFLGHPCLLGLEGIRLLSWLQYATSPIDATTSNKLDLLSK